jgi:hypothetical protein
MTKVTHHDRYRRIRAQGAYDLLQAALSLFIGMLIILVAIFAYNYASEQTKIQKAEQQATAIAAATHSYYGTVRGYGNINSTVLVTNHLLPSGWSDSGTGSGTSSTMQVLSQNVSLPGNFYSNAGTGAIYTNGGGNITFPPSLTVNVGSPGANGVSEIYVTNPTTGQSTGLFCVCTMTKSSQTPPGGGVTVQVPDTKMVVQAATVLSTTNAVIHDPYQGGSITITPSQ